MFSDSKYALIPFSELPAPYRQEAMPRAFEKDEFEAAEKLLEKAVAVFNEKRTDDFVIFMTENPASDWAQTDLFIELERYYRQYFSYFNEKGDRCLWINLFCRPVGDWKTRRVHVDGGGVCFFSVGFNLDTGKRFDFVVNDKK